MKRFLLLLLVLPCLIHAQDNEIDTDGFMGFGLKDSTATEIDWQRDTLFEKIELTGKTALSYALRPVNDSLTQLLIRNKGMWQLQEVIQHSAWVYGPVSEGVVNSKFMITDFDKDGDQDLTCWAYTSVHANVWTIIFINDQAQHKLVRLIDTAENDSDIWNDPRYDLKTGLITTELYSGAYGEPAIATYTLKGTVATPVFKEAYDSTNPDYIITATYKGKKGKWKKVKKTREETPQEEEGEPNGYVALEKDGYVMFGFEDIFDPQTGGLDFKAQEIWQNITLKGKTPLEYQLKVVDAGTALMLQNIDKAWVVRDTILCSTDTWTLMEGWPLVSSFRVTDFDKDGNEDLMYTDVSGGHNALTTLIYLNHPKTGRLVKLYNTADATYLWDDPQYDAKNKTVTTSVSGGLHGIHINTTYKLKKATAIPLTKTEIDHTDENVGIERNYKYKDRHWKLVKTVRQ